MRERIIVRLVGGPHDGGVIEVDMEHAEGHAEGGRFEFPLPNAPFGVQPKGNLKDSKGKMSECGAVYSMPIPFPRDGVAEFCGYLDTWGPSDAE